MWYCGVEVLVSPELQIWLLQWAVASGTGDGSSCLSRELQAWSTAVGCSSGTCGWKILRFAKWIHWSDCSCSTGTVGASRFVASVDTVAYVSKEYRIRVDRY